MNVWIRKARKKSDCYHCHKPVETGEFQVVCQWFMKVRSKTWQKKMLFHPQCWIDRAVAELSTKHIVETRGRKRNQISDDDREKREKILRRRASFVQRLNVKMNEFPTDYGKVGRLLDRLEELKVEIELVGGVPKSWQ